MRPEVTPPPHTRLLPAYGPAPSNGGFAPRHVSGVQNVRHLAKILPNPPWIFRGGNWKAEGRGASPQDTAQLSGTARAAAASCVSEVTALHPHRTNNSFPCRSLENMYLTARLSCLPRALANLPTATLQTGNWPRGESVRDAGVSNRLSGTVLWFNTKSKNIVRFYFIVL